jgi:ATP-dependent helicase HrpA
MTTVKRNIPELTYNADLPIVAKKDEIIATIRRHRVVIISGATGSGKTTQIPKFCLEAGVQGKIGCTQPRRIAAITVAHRIAEELGEDIGRTVGYKIRFADKTGDKSVIKIMTDGMLLAEVQHDPLLRAYSTIIVDEAHERSLNIDFVLGILKTLIRRRKNLKLIITSATIDTEKFSKAFDNAPIIEVSGRMYPVEVRYMPPEPVSEDEEEQTHVELAVKAICSLHQKSPYGDILAFMPTEQDIRETCDLLEGRNLSNINIFPMYARLSASEQAKVFSRPPGRKIIVATNVAETSITIPGIKYVVDTGLARMLQYSPRSRTTALPVVPISRSSADQRLGRCGRMENGVCIRLYSQEDYESRPQFTLPEILRSNLAEVILRMVSLGLGNIAKFPFIDRPAPNSIKDGFDLLTELGAIETGDRISLTDKGRMMAQMPLDPRLSRMLIEAQNQGCVQEIAVIASALSIQDPRERPSDKQTQADQKHALFHDPTSDFITLLNIWNRYHQHLAEHKSFGKMKKFCKEYFLSFRRMREWRDIHAQICEILTSPPASLLTREGSLYPAIHKSVLSGFLSNIAVKKEKHIFKATKGREAMIFPGSAIFKHPGTWIVSAEMVETSRLFARTAANIDPLWAEELGKNQCKYSYSDPHWERSRGEVVASEQVSLYGLILIAGRAVAYGHIKPEEACDIFIRTALVEGDIQKPFAFMEYNRSLIESVRQMEDKIRRRDILISDEDIYDFYRKKLDGIFDIRTLQRILRKKGDDFLKMTHEELMRYQPEQDNLLLYPDKISVGNTVLPCDYHFEPGNLKDGVTVKIPSAQIHTVQPELLDWVVPGLLKEKITLLLKSLPKEYRKQLVPVSQTADIIAADIPKSETALPTALSNFIYQRFKVDIPASAWSSDALPDYLKMRIAITGPKGEEIRSGRDKAILFQGIDSQIPTSDEFEAACKAYEKQGITSWDFGDLPKNLTLKGKSGTKWTVFPGLSYENPRICLKVFQTAPEALTAHFQGVSALCCLYFVNELKFVKKSLSLTGQSRDHAACMGGAKAVEKKLYDAVISDLFAKNIRTKAEFDAYLVSVKPLILQKGQERLGSISGLMKACFEFEKTLCGLEDSKASNQGVLNFLSGLRAEMLRLVPEDAMQRYKPEQMPDVERYIKALAIRAQRALTDFEKDRTKAAEISPYADKFNKLVKEMSLMASEEKKQALDELFWLIEEYKVSLFAQELKTRIPASKKRLDQKIKEIERMV